MIDISKFRFGDIIYQVAEESTSFYKKRIYMTDAEGNEWFRYDRPDYIYSIDELVYCGKVIHVVSGDVDKDNIYETEYHYRYEDGKIHYEYDSEIPKIHYWFATREEAEAYIAQEKARKK